VNDIETKMMKPLTDTYMEAFLKDYLERMQQLGTEEEAGPQQQPQQPPASATVCAGGRKQPVRCPCTYSSHDAGLHVRPLQLDE